MTNQNLSWDEMARRSQAFEEHARYDFESLPEEERPHFAATLGQNPTPQHWKRMIEAHRSGEAKMQREAPSDYDAYMKGSAEENARFEREHPKRYENMLKWQMRTRGRG